MKKRKKMSRTRTMTMRRNSRNTKVGGKLMCAKSVAESSAVHIFSELTGWHTRRRQTNARSAERASRSRQSSKLTYGRTLPKQYENTQKTKKSTFCDLRKEWAGCCLFGREVSDMNLIPACRSDFAVWSFCDGNKTSTSHCSLFVHLKVHWCDSKKTAICIPPFPFLFSVERNKLWKQCKHQRRVVPTTIFHTDYICKYFSDVRWSWMWITTLELWRERWPILKLLMAPLVVFVHPSKCEQMIKIHHRFWQSSDFSLT